MPRIMIVENSCKPLWFAKKLLSSLNFEIVFETGNGYEAIEKYELIKPDFIILDLKLTKNEGQNVLKEIKKINSQAKIIVITSSCDEKQFNESLDNGALAVLKIPFKVQEFLTLVTHKDLKYEQDSFVSPVILDD